MAEPGLAEIIPAEHDSSGARNIFASAEQNDAAIRVAYSALTDALSGSPASEMAEFAALVAQEWQPSINMPLHVASRFVRRGGYQHMRAFAERMSRLSARPEGEVLAEKLGNWRACRDRFESFFEQGPSFIYSAINIGGLGASRYAPYSVIFSREAFLARRQVAILRGDSLTDYQDDDGLPNREKVITHLCTPSLTAESASLKHKDLVGSTARANWPAMVCSGGGYQEAIFVVEPAPDEIAEVRVAETEYLRIWDLAFADFSRKLHSDEAATAADFADLIEALEERGLELKRIVQC